MSANQNSNEHDRMRELIGKFTMPTWPITSRTARS